MTLDYSTFEFEQEKAVQGWKAAVRMQEGNLKDVVEIGNQKKNGYPERGEWPTVLTVPKKTNSVSTEMGPSWRHDILSRLFTTLATFWLRSTSVSTRSFLSDSPPWSLWKQALKICPLCVGGEDLLAFSLSSVSTKIIIIIMQKLQMSKEFIYLFGIPQIATGEAQI